MPAEVASVSCEDDVYGGYTEILAVEEDKNEEIVDVLSFHSEKREDSIYRKVPAAEDSLESSNRPFSEGDQFRRSSCASTLEKTVRGCTYIGKP